MFKSILKLLVLTLLLTAGFVFMSGSSKVSALSWNCSGAPYSSWGNGGAGGGSGLMGSMIVRAVDTSNGNPLNVNYTLNSALEGNSNPDLDKRIFHWPIGTGRDDQHTFATGEHLYNGGAGGYNCNGWSVLGPGTSTNVGNQWVVDCGGSGQEGTSDFWISHIENPGGAAGHWKLIDETTGQVMSNDVNKDGSAVLRIHVINGGNISLKMEWYPNPPPKQPSQGNCNYLDAYNQATYTNAGGSHKTRAHVQVTGVTGVSVNGGPADYSQHAIDGYAPDKTGDFSSKDKIWRYVAEQPTIGITVTEQFLGNDGNWYNIPGNPGGLSITPTCIVVACHIDSVVDAIPRPNNVIAGGDPVYVNGTIYNNSPPDGPILNNLYLTGTGGNSTGSGPLGPGDSAPVSLSTTAPGGAPQNWTVSYSVAGTSTSGSCQATVGVYQYFTLEPHAELRYNTAENPGPIGYDTYIKNNSNGSVSAPTSSIFTFTPYSGGAGCPNVGPVNTSGPYAPGAPDYTIGPSTCNPPGYQAGDRYCSEIDFTGGYNSGFVGPNGETYSTGFNGPTGDRQCVTIVNKPYFKTYNSGVEAGGKFSGGGDCSGGGALGGWNDNTGGQDRGAGSQLSALALIKITGFASAQATVPGTGLTFANGSTDGSVTITNDHENPQLGGNFDPTGGYCLTDMSPGTGSTIEPGGYVYPGNGSVTGSQSIFVNGDVYINSDVKYNLGGWTINVDGSTNVPSFILHATGNIYIDPGVKQLDGTYIATGKIYTCGQNSGGGNFTPVAPSNMYATCKNQLTINGAFIANQVDLMRTYGSLRNATGNENPSGGSHTCSYSGGSNSKPVCAGEIFQLSPELYLSTPNVQLPSNGSTQYDAITSLPPVL